MHWQSKAGRRIRTDDLLITNQLLYQLSYAGNNGRSVAQRRLRGKRTSSRTRSAIGKAAAGPPEFRAGVPRRNE